MPPPAPPPPIRADHSNAFANNTMRIRLPAIIDETIALNPDYPAHIQRRLRQLRTDIANGARIQNRALSPAGDTAAWAETLQRQREILETEPTWHNAEWFFAETRAYRCLLEAVRWQETGRDPFLPRKLAELRGEALWRLVERASAPREDAETELRQTVAFDLWANRIDLSYSASLERGAEISPEDWLVDDRDALLAALCASTGGRAHIIADNAGSELAIDLVLADALLRHAVERVDICLKQHPTFVSDATPADAWLMLEAMKRRAPALAERLYRAWNAARLRFLPHPYWNSSRFLWDLPPDIRAPLADSRLVVVKGDANYRRAVGDCLWPAHRPFADVLRYLDAPVLCLRILKSDPVVGLPTAETAARLDRQDPQWRVNGKRGLAQFKPQTSNSQEVAVAG